jgi:GMP synthase (glutamine-hydrolysing)
VIAACSGGVDSTVAALVARQALNDHLYPVFIDTGFVREDEPQQIKRRLATSQVGLEVKIVRAAGRFLDAVKDKSNAEEKRAAFRETFYQVLKEEAEKNDCKFVVQGTIAPDWIETQGGIKTQHNVLEQVGIDPAQRYGFRIIEPLSELYKDQVRALGRHLELPVDLSDRQPFPGPGLLVRCIGTVTKSKLNLLRPATRIVEEKLRPFKYDQYFAAVISNDLIEDESAVGIAKSAADSLGLPPNEVSADIFSDRVTGVKGDTRAYGRIAGIKLREENRETFGWLQDKLQQSQTSVIQKFADITRVAFLVKEKRSGPSLSVILRAVQTHDFMTAAVAPVPWKILKDIADEILKFGTSSRVYYDVTPKPPGTIEFE